MIEAITAIYEEGVFKPLQPVQLPEHLSVRITIVTDEDGMVQTQKRAAQKIMGLGRSGLTTVARQHNEYLYRKDW